LILFDKHLFKKKQFGIVFDITATSAV